MVKQPAPGVWLLESGCAALADGAGLISQGESITPKSCGTKRLASSSRPWKYTRNDGLEKRGRGG